MFVLFFLANESWHDVELTLAKKGKLLYKHIMIDYGETDYSQQKKKQSKFAVVQSDLGMQEQEMSYMSSYRSNLITNNLQANLMSKEYNPVLEKGDDRPKRRVKELFFQCMCMFVGAYFSMIFTSWTSIWGHVFTSVDIIDYSTIWVRFASTIAGLLYVILMAIRNLIQSKRYS